MLFSSVISASENTQLPPVHNNFNDNISVGFQYRGRLDIYNGVNKKAYGDDSINSTGSVKGKPDDTIYLQQIIAGITYKPFQDLEFKAYMYDSRGYNSSLRPDDFVKNSATADAYTMSYYDDHLELFETYIRNYNFISKNLTFTLGRQQLGYGDRRIFGPGKWGNTMGWLWDATHLSYKRDKDFLDIWYGQTRVKETDDFSILEKHRFQGVGVYGHIELPYMKLEPFFAWRNNLHHEVKPEDNLYYYGFRAYKNSSGFIYDTTFVKESGTKGNLDVDASAYAIKAGYKISSKYEPKLLIGSIYASGDKDASDNVSETFSTPFGATDGLHYGRMDIMAWSNMKDMQASLSIKPMKDLYLEAAYHHFNLAQTSDKWYDFSYTNQVANSYSHIGDEYDLILKYKASKNIDFLAIGTYLVAGDFIIKNQIANNNASKIFLQFTYKFNTNMAK